MIAVMAELLHHWRFASDAARLAEVGALLLALAGLALLTERRQRHQARRRPGGCMPWTGVFLVLAFAGFSLLAVGLPPLLHGP